LTDAAETRNARGLARGIVEVMQLARQPGTAQACRDHARRFSAARIGEQIEALYRQITR